VFKDSLYTSQETKCTFITKIKPLVLFKRNITLCSGNFTGKLNSSKKMQYFNVGSVGTHSHYFASDQLIMGKDTKVFLSQRFECKV